tara:strand:- start:5035 stop:6393 length:1359 start_codon:yes stop_codon:yes gene_type:complete
VPATDTIVAVATAPGRGGIGIVRLSGPRARAIGETLSGQPLQARQAHHCEFRDADGDLLDSGIALFFVAPHSFTGEDVVELQAHGSPVVMDMLLREACRLGARLARAGEFTERAFLNDRIDLAQAEAIADLIASSTEQGARNASRSLQGEFSRRIDELVAEVTALRVYIEAAIDFPEEEIDFIAEGEVASRLDTIVGHFDAVARQARQGSLVREGMKLVIAGRPNAGKSSLLNALSGQDTAIVTAIEGTTRDILREHIEVDGMPLHIVDTAGLRDSNDVIEQEGVRRARAEMASADRILLVVDGSEAREDFTPQFLWPDGEDQIERPVTVVANKCDLSGVAPQLREQDAYTVLHLSAKTGAGMALLREHLKQCMGYQDANEGAFSARRRHLDALQRARAALDNGRQQLAHAGAAELLAEDLRQCQAHLGEITGAVSSDALLGEIFSSFCIGK